MQQPPILIAGGGIGGLVMALTLHQIGVPCRVYDQVSALRPLGVGINLQPNAVRELFDLGIGAEALDRIGVPAREWALVGMNGNDIHAEQRGTDAGYRWPQYAVHRGAFHMLLAETFRARAGDDALRLGCRATGYRADAAGVTLFLDTPDGAAQDRGVLLIGADGIHSAIRAQMHPDQPPIHWGGALMWRGITRMRPVRTGSSFVGLGTEHKRMVLYPISAPDAEGLATVNWIAEITVDPSQGWSRTGWFSQTGTEVPACHFEDWRYDWLDVPALIRGAPVAYENPMIDRDPIPTWHDGRTILIGDAAHAMYPTGSNGASQAIMDARVLGRQVLDHGPTPAALAAFDAELCGPVSALVLRNRGAGPFGLLSLVHDRSGGTFDDIESVVPRAERDAFMAGYKQAAGFARDALNGAPSTIPPGARVPSA